MTQWGKSADLLRATKLVTKQFNNHVRWTESFVYHWAASIDSVGYVWDQRETFSEMRLFKFQHCLFPPYGKQFPAKMFSKWFRDLHTRMSRVDIVLVVDLLFNFERIVVGIIGVWEFKGSYRTEFFGISFAKVSAHCKKSFCSKFKSLYQDTRLV